MSKLNKGFSLDHLVDAILCLESEEECLGFLKDVCTPSELSSIAQRLEIAKMLKDGKTYLDIEEKIGASTATVGRVSNSINYGNGSYDVIFERINWKNK